VAVRRRRESCAEALKQSLRDRRREHRVAARNHTDARDQLRRRHVLEYALEVGPSAAGGYVVATHFPVSAE
jgi:hypothetical protein